GRADPAAGVDHGVRHLEVDRLAVRGMEEDDRMIEGGLPGLLAMEDPAHHRAHRPPGAAEEGAGLDEQADAVEDDERTGNEEQGAEGLLGAHDEGTSTRRTPRQGSAGKKWVQRTTFTSRRILISIAQSEPAGNPCRSSIRTRGAAGLAASGPRPR